MRRHRNRSVVLRCLCWIAALAIFAIGIAVINFALTDTSYVPDEDPDGALYAVLFGLGISVYAVFFIRSMLRKVHKRYSRYYKALIVPPLVANMVERATYPSEFPSGRFVCSYEANQFISPSQLTVFPMFHHLDKAREWQGEDLFSGTLGLTDFQLSEIFAQEVERDTDSGNDVKTTLFNGFVFIADFHKHFEGTITISSRKGKYSYYSAPRGTDMKTISHEFDQLYRLRTTDSTTARYLLPVDMYERLIRLRHLFPKQGIQLCLHDGILAIAIHHLDFFEAKGIRKLENDAIRHTYDELRSILDIVDLLNLNTRIWGKE